jgi:hypothetical protein
MDEWVSSRSRVPVTLAESGEFAIGIKQGARTKGFVRGFGGKPSIALDEIKSLQFWQDLFHETEHGVLLEAMALDGLRCPIAHRELGDPDGLAKKLMNLLEPSD